VCDDGVIVSLSQTDGFVTEHVDGWNDVDRSV
jgi:hypothetical protein